MDKYDVRNRYLQYLEEQSEKKSINGDRLINLKARTDTIWLNAKWLSFYTYIILPMFIVLGVIFEVYTGIHDVRNELYFIVIILLPLAVCALIYTYWPNSLGYFLNIIFIILFKYGIILLLGHGGLRIISYIVYVNIYYFYKRRFIFFAKNYSEINLIGEYENYESVWDDSESILVKPVYSFFAFNLFEESYMNFYIYILLPAFVGYELLYTFLFFIEGLPTVGFAGIIILIITIGALVIINNSKKWAFYINMLLIIIQGIAILIYIAILIKSLLAGLICGSIWIIANFIYFFTHKF